MYKPRDYWDAIGKVSTIGCGDEPGRFGTDETGNALYKLPQWSSQPQWWDYMQPGIRVLDIGSGNGLQVGRLVHQGVFAVGCDISLALLTVAQGNMLSHDTERLPMLVQWDGIHMPFETNVFDRVCTNTVLQHVVDDDALDCIFSETSRILKSRGLFLICELVSPRDIQTAPHVKLRSVQTYGRIALRYGLHVRKLHHTVSTYVAIQSVYGRLKYSASISRTNSSTQDNSSAVRAHAANSFILYTKRIARKLTSDFSRVADALLNLSHIADKLPGQDQIIFEKT